MNPTSIKQLNLLGLKINPISPDQLVKSIEWIIEKSPKSEYIVTPNSEFFVYSQTDEKYRNAVNSAILSIPDGVFVQWATTFLELPIKSKSKFWGKLEVIAQFVLTGASIIFNKKSINKIIPHRLSGSIFAHDIVKLAQKKGYKVALAGGYSLDEKGARSSEKILAKYPYIIAPTTGKIAMEVFKQHSPDVQFITDIPLQKDRTLPDDTLEILKESDADILLMCQLPVLQEKWLFDNLAKTGIKFGIGLGGTFDYVSGIKTLPPKWMRAIGLEWLLRPILMEGVSKRMVGRIKRAWFTGFFGGAMLALKEKMGKIGK